MPATDGNLPAVNERGCDATEHRGSFLSQKDETEIGLAKVRAAQPHFVIE